MATKKQRASKATAGRAVKRTTTKRAAAAPARAKSAGRGTLSIRTAAPGFTVNDLQRSLAWYRDVLGFAVKERWENEGVLQGVELAAGLVTFMLGQDDWKKGRDRVKGAGFRIHCTTDENVDRLAERIKAHGGTLSQEPRDEWGMRALAVEDPDGFKITIASVKR
jgi:catechol 2,3-dioxygenase-like lactoylglutathione lyase family enzyme